MAERGKRLKLKPPPLVHPKGLEREYQRILKNSFTLLFDLVDERFTQRLPALLSQAAMELEPQRFDAFSDELQTLLNGIFIDFGRQVSVNSTKAAAKIIGTQVSDWNRAQNDKVWKKVLGVDLFRQEPYLQGILDSYANTNANLITTLSQRHISGVENIAMEAVRQGLPISAVEERIRKLVGKTEANIRLIARDQVSKLNGQLTKVRQTALGVKQYVWRTSLDERVRASHRVKEGVVYSWDKPPADTGHPGEDYQCRCYAEPVLEDLIPEEGISGGFVLPMDAQGFGT